MSAYMTASVAVAGLAAPQARATGTTTRVVSSLSSRAHASATFGAVAKAKKPIRATFVFNAISDDTETTPDPTPDKSTDEQPAKPKRKFVKKNIAVKDEDIAIGNEYAGKVKSVQAYGCFVDFGARSDGLVHISELTNGFVESVGDVVSEGQEVKVWIKTIDAEKGRFSLTMKPPPTEEEVAERAEAFAAREARATERKARDSERKAAEQKAKTLKRGQKMEGVVKSIQVFGAFVEVMEGVEGLVHVSEMSDDYNVRPEEFCEVGKTVTVRVLEVSGNRVKLSMKEKMDAASLSVGDVEVEASASAIQYAFKAKGLSPAQFPGFDALEAAKAAEAEAAAAAEAAEEDTEAAEVAAAVAVVEEAEAPAAAEPEAEPEAPPAEEA